VIRVNEAAPAEREERRHDDSSAPETGEPGAPKAPLGEPMSRISITP
jgi:hypothetical protein